MCKYDLIRISFLNFTMNVITLHSYMFLPKREKIMSFGTVEMIEAFFILLRSVDKISQNINSPTKL